jgi:uncharacterized protein
LLPEALLRYSVRGSKVVPHFLGDHDLPWLRTLLDDADRFVGRRQRELAEQLREPRDDKVPAGKYRLAFHVLRGLMKTRRVSAVPAAKARAAVFGAANTGSDRATTLANVATTFGVAVAELEASLFSDLPGEGLVVTPEPCISPLELSLRANVALAQALLFRATSVVIEVEGNARALVRHAKLRGLICSARPHGVAESAALEISGPLALFHRTLVYGRALGELLPLCSWCRHFRLFAGCVLREQHVELELSSADPIFPAAEPRRFDSQVEERFARDFARLAPDWHVIREPEPIAAQSTLVFPDFALQHRDSKARRWLLEIVGFWTPDYVGRKLAQYRSAGLPNLILCIDQDRECADGDLPTGAHIIRYRRRIDPALLMPILEAGESIGPSHEGSGQPKRT